ncbi:endoribonuclease YbeY-like [Asterias rubens]|uniref:endoribonuclease YbeY-like n=1 Tax=Asterias rubens TaxID=7604 RepID=UPI001455D757|nr:endoribonuclease YbeY-like [Asterias rubens]
MTLLLRNLQKTVVFDLPKLKTDINLLRRIFRTERYDLGVICMEDGQLREMNKMYRGRNEPTDVLSFPSHESLAPGRLPDPWSDLADLGDIFLGMPYIQKQCELDGTDVDTVLPVLVTHGICHLIGYKHESEEQFRQMLKKESDILKEYNKITNSNLKPLTKNVESQYH